MDETPELDEIYSINTDSRSTRTELSNQGPIESPTLSTPVRSNASKNQTAGSTRGTPRFSSPGTHIASPAQRGQLTNSSGSSHQFHPPSNTYHANGANSGPIGHHNTIESLLRAADLSENVVQDGSGDMLPAALPAEDFGHVSPSVGPNTPQCWPHTSVQEACLMRYFVDNLACWVCKFSAFQIKTPTSSTYF